MPRRRIVTWNIWHGGGTGERHRQVVARLLAYEADLLIITEFRPGPSGRALLRALTEGGYSISHPPIKGAQNTVLVASREPILGSGPLQEGLPSVLSLWQANIAWIRVVGVYLPSGEAKRPFWDALIAAASMPTSPDLFIGDFNTGTNTLDRSGGALFVGADYMARVADAGLTDLWRSRFPAEREYTWYSARGLNGFRLDHAFGSARLTPLVNSCRYDHGPRLERISDHSAMIIETQEDSSG